MPEKIERKDVAGAGIAGSLAVGGGKTSLDFIKEASKFKEVTQVNKKRIDAFLSNIKAGDVILESDPKGSYSGQLFQALKTSELRSEIKKALKIDIGETLTKNIKKLKFNDVIQIGGGGSRYHHASIYLGNGKIAEMVPDGAKITNLKDAYKGKRLISLRVSEDLKIGNNIAKNAKDLVKFAPDYPSNKDLIKDTLKRSLGTTKKGFDGLLTCTEFADKSVELGSNKVFVNKFRVDPQDILSSNAKVISSYNYGASTPKEKMLNFFGKNFKNGKYYIMGAGLGMGALAGYHLYNKLKDANGIKVPYTQKSNGESFLNRVAVAGGAKLKGKWVTFRGRRIFIREGK